MNKKIQGFTLIQMVIALAVVTTISAVTIGVMQTQRTRSDILLGKMQEVGADLLRIKKDLSCFPTQLIALSAPRTSTFCGMKSAELWRGPYASPGMHFNQVNGNIALDDIAPGTELTFTTKSTVMPSGETETQWLLVSTGLPDGVYQYTEPTCSTDTHARCFFDPATKQVTWVVESSRTPVGATVAGVAPISGGAGGGGGGGSAPVPALPPVAAIPVSGVITPTTPVPTPTLPPPSPTTTTPPASNPVPPTTTTTPAPPGPTNQDAAAYHPSCSDEFDNGFNTAIWNDALWYEGGGNATKNYTVENGVLKIWPQKDASGNYFNRTLNTDGKCSQTYGFYEMEAKLPVGAGTWPGFWLLNRDVDTPTPVRPEIDIMEAYAGSSDPNYATVGADGIPHPTGYGATAWVDSANLPGVESGPLRSGTDLSAGFHKYGLKWEPGKQTYYFDGVPVWTVNITMDKPMFMLVDLYFGSVSGSPSDALTPTGSSNAFEIKYVRSWSLNN